MFNETRVKDPPSSMLPREGWGA